MYLYYIQRIHHLKPADMCSWLELCRWINLTPVRFVIFCSPTRPIVPAMESTIQKNHHYRIVIIPMELSKATTNIAFPLNMWCCVIGGHLIGPYIFPQHVTGDIYANFLQDELPTLLENVPVQTQQTYYQHDGAPPHFSQVVRQYLNHKFPNWWIGRGGAQNWPPRSLDLNPLDYHVRGYMKSRVYAHKLNMREESFWFIYCTLKNHNSWTVANRTHVCMTFLTFSSGIKYQGHRSECACSKWREKWWFKWQFLWGIRTGFWSFSYVIYENSVRNF